jgi:hypothetical protein
VLFCETVRDLNRVIDRLAQGEAADLLAEFGRSSRFASFRSLLASASGS